MFTCNVNKNALNSILGKGTFAEKVFILMGTILWDTGPPAESVEKSVV